MQNGIKLIKMNDFEILTNHRNDLVRKIEFHQKMAFELKENLIEMDYLIETKNFQLAKQKIWV